MGRVTEGRNAKSMHIDTMSTLEALKLINREDQQVPKAISDTEVIKSIGATVDIIVDCLKNNGRLFYMGAGTSGRLGVLDAAECVPTYGTDPELVQGLIAGGSEAMLEAVEGAEDSRQKGAEDLKNHNLSSRDFVVGIAASGTTPYVIGGLDYAKEIGAHTSALSCNKDSLIGQHAEISIEAVVGPEVVTGSTRMKAGTAEKLILNMISTTSMIKLGKVYGNLMVDVKATNVKLVDRAKRIICEATGVSKEDAQKYYEESRHNPKVAIVMIMGNCNYEMARNILIKNDGFIAKAIKSLNN